MAYDVRIDVLADAIKDLPRGEMKDALADDLKFAQDINGTVDPALRGIKRLVISGIRRELLTHERIADAIKVHIQDCPLAKIPTGKSGTVMAWAEVLKPYRWPVAIICFSPFAGDIVAKVITVFK